MVLHLVIPDRHCVGNLFLRHAPTVCRMDFVCCTGMKINTFFGGLFIEINAISVVKCLMYEILKDK